MAKLIEKHTLHISITCLLAVVVVVFGFGRTVQGVDDRISSQEKKIAKIEKKIEPIAEMRVDITWIKDAIKRMEAKDDKKNN